MNKPTISVCMIVKNEEALLERALQSTIGADNWFILDTGSQDRTIEIAKKFGATVFLDYIWSDSFSDAQNFLLSKVRGREDAQWILSLDADECLITGIDSVREAIAVAKNVVSVKMEAEGPDKNDFYFGRIFRNTPDIYWVSSIHKHLNVPGAGEQIGNVRIMYGWSPAHKLDPDRSLRMLESAVARGEGIPRNIYYLGREYWYKQRFQEAVDTLKKYVPLSEWDAELGEAFLLMAQAYAQLKNEEECATAVAKAIIVNANFKEAILYMADIVAPHNRDQWLRMARSANNEGVLWKRVENEPSPFNTIVLAPHNDDESLYMAYTLMRIKPLVIVITDSYIQPERGDHGCDALARRQETIKAMRIAGCPVMFLGIKDTELTEELLRERLAGINAERVYAPAIQGGNEQHDIVGKVAKEIWGNNCEQYTTYTKTELYTTGSWEIKPTKEEVFKKQTMLLCYTSQIQLASTRPHFDAVSDGKSEWLQ